MYTLKQYCAGWILTVMTAAAGAAPIADSSADFAAAQGAHGWTYGFFNAGAAPGLAYAPANFIAFDTFNPILARWEASDAQVGANNNDFLSLNAAGGHPNGIGPAPQDSIIWAVRRYTSEVAGTLDLSYLLRKNNTANVNGRGITGHLFVDGNELLDQFIANADGVGVQGVLTIAVTVGSPIDLAIDPTGLETSPRDFSIHSARADGTDFSIVLNPHAVPVPPGSWLIFGGTVGLIANWRRKRTG